MLKTMLVTRVVDEDGETSGAYYREVRLPFVPSLGMKLKLSSSTPLWETADGRELDPPLREIVYNFDDDELYCLFEVDSFLVSKYWTQISNLQNSYELKQFTVHTERTALTTDRDTHSLKNVKTQLRMFLYAVIVPAGLLVVHVLNDVLSDNSVL